MNCVQVLKFGVAIVVFGSLLTYRPAAAQSTTTPSYPLVYALGDWEPQSVGVVWPADLNDHGQIVGWSSLESGLYHAFLWAPDGALTDLGTLPAPFDFTSEAVAVNNQGEVVGMSSDQSRRHHAVLWANGVITDLGTFGGADGYAVAINNHSQVLGASKGISDTVPTGGFLWASGVVTELGTLQGGGRISVVDLNDRGQVIGSASVTTLTAHAFVWASGIMTDLGTLGGDSSGVVAINELGQVAGNSETAQGEHHAFLWANGVMTDLGTLPGYDFSEVTAINNRGQVAGWSGGHAVVWTDGVIADLGTLPAPYASGSRVLDINDDGVAVGLSTGETVGPWAATIWQDGIARELELGPRIFLFGTEGFRINRAGQILARAIGDAFVEAFLVEPKAPFLWFLP